MKNIRWFFYAILIFLFASPAFATLPCIPQPDGDCIGGGFSYPIYSTRETEYFFIIAVATLSLILYRATQKRAEDPSFLRGVLMGLVIVFLSGGFGGADIFKLVARQFNTSYGLLFLAILFYLVNSLLLYKTRTKDYISYFVSTYLTTLSAWLLYQTTYIEQYGILNRPILEDALRLTILVLFIGLPFLVVNVGKLLLFRKPEPITKFRISIWTALFFCTLYAGFIYILFLPRLHNL